MADSTTCEALERKCRAFYLKQQQKKQNKGVCSLCLRRRTHISESPSENAEHSGVKRVLTYRPPRHCQVYWNNSDVSPEECCARWRWAEWQHVNNRKHYRERHIDKELFVLQYVWLQSWITSMKKKKKKIPWWEKLQHILMSNKTEIWLPTHRPKYPITARFFLQGCNWRGFRQGRRSAAGCQDVWDTRLVSWDLEII